MTANILLDVLKEFTERAVSELIMPVQMQRGDTEQQYRSADIYKMRLPDSNSAQKKAPYIIHQVITGKHKTDENDINIRSIFCVYCNDEQEGALMLLNLMERLEIELLKSVVLGKQFKLDRDKGIEFIIYPDNTAPFFAGEMSTVWKLPVIKDEIGIDFLHSDVWNK